jgi:hypothetical protein
MLFVFRRIRRRRRRRRRHHERRGQGSCGAKAVYSLPPPRLL